MLESLVAAWNSTMDVAKKVMDRIWGEQTAQESSLMKRAEKAEAEYRAAAQRLREATDRDDDKAKSVALRDVNAWRSELNRLRDEAASKHA